MSPTQANNTDNQLVTYIFHILRRKVKCNKLRLQTITIDSVKSIKRDFTLFICY